MSFGERAEISDVVRQALELERDAAQGLRARRLLALRKRLHHLAIRRGVSDAGVARQRLRIVDRALVRPADQRVLDPAVLIAEGDLEVEDVLAVALEAEVPGLDDPGVDRADRHLVDLVALHAVEVRHADQGGFAARSREGLMAGPLGSVVANRLEPRVAARAQAELLGDLALEQVHLGAGGGQRLERVALHAGPAEVQTRRAGRRRARPPGPPPPDPGPRFRRRPRPVARPGPRPRWRRAAPPATSSGTAARGIARPFPLVAKRIATALQLTGSLSR